MCPLSGYVSCCLYHSLTCENMGDDISLFYNSVGETDKEGSHVLLNNRGIMTPSPKRNMW